MCWENSLFQVEIWRRKKGVYRFRRVFQKGVWGNSARRAQRVPFGYFQTDTASTNTPALWCRCIRCTKCALRRHRAFRAAGAAVLLVRRNKNEGADNNENEREHV